MRVLVVDDEELIVEFLKRSLKLDMHVVDTARNGQIALEKATKHSYDVVILDVIMPELNGIAVCHELRRLNIQTPILMLTSRDGEASRVEGLDAGADDYLTKPFGYSELTARLRALLRRPRPVLPTELSVGPLKLDPVKKHICIGGEPLELRPKEYALLEYLMRNPGKVISREEFLKNVWYISAHNASNRLEVCMYHIRAKVNVDPKEPLLKTVRGYGYVLSSPLLEA